MFVILTKYKRRHQQSHLDCFRERRGENKTKSKREDPNIVALCDELLSEPNATGPKVREALRDRGHTISLSTIYRIARDLTYKWTKPWYTDVLTTAQKFKRKLFCMRLLRLSNQALLERLSEWLWTDEKWWDLVGPSMSQYVKANSKKEAKTKNQVCCFFAFFFFRSFIFVLSFCVCRCQDIKARKVE